MAVQDEDSFKRYAANGIATVYAIPFLLLNAADLQVILDNVEVTSGFTVSGLGTNAGSITFSVAPSGDLLLQRVVPFERLTDYQNNGDLLAETANRDFDRLWLAMQELRRDDSTALRTSLLEPEGINALPESAVRAYRILGFDADGEPIVSTFTLAEIEQQPALATAAAAAASASASAASASAVASAGSATASAASATASAAARDKAQEWADKSEDSEVEPGKFSAKHWAAKAAASLSGLDTRVSDLENKGIKRATAQATTSGTAIDFTGIPSWVRRITIALNAVSTNGSSSFQVQIGGGSIETTGYAGSFVSLTSSAAAANPIAGAGFTLGISTASAGFSGTITLVNVSGNVWVASWTVGASGIAYGWVGGGTKSLSALLDRIRLTTLNGTDLFDAGSVNIIYEG